ncbi:MAG: DUF6580 family putative transport protein [Chloroherpetonaceae bacterium]|nr:DUF6580 family putative transport protein [Chloroherpetonaceae bacterium]
MMESILVFLGALSRVLPHPANFTAISAVALYGANKITDKRRAFLIPLAAMLLSDGILELMYRIGLSPFPGIHSGMWYVYGAFACVSAIGFWIRAQFSYGRLAAGTLLSSVSFFVITNFGVWLSGWYGYTIEGLIACYVAAIPFFRNQVLGDVLFVSLFFGVNYLLRRYVLNRQTA